MAPDSAPVERGEPIVGVQKVNPAAFDFESMA